MVLLNKPFFFLFFLTVLIANVYSDECDDPGTNECLICWCGCRGLHGVPKVLCSADCVQICGCPDPPECSSLDNRHTLR